MNRRLESSGIKFLVITLDTVGQGGSISGIEKKVAELEKLQVGSKTLNLIVRCHMNR